MLTQLCLGTTAANISHGISTSHSHTPRTSGVVLCTSPPYSDHLFWGCAPILLFMHSTSTDAKAHYTLRVETAPSQPALEGRSLAGEQNEDFPAPLCDTVSCTPPPPAAPLRGPGAVSLFPGHTGQLHDSRSTSPFSIPASGILFLGYLLASRHMMGWNKVSAAECCVQYSPNFIPSSLKWGGIQQGRYAVLISQVQTLKLSLLVNVRMRHASAELALMGEGVSFLWGKGKMVS